MDDLVRLIDVGPTLLEHQGAAELPGADGPFSERARSIERLVARVRDQRAP